MNIEKNDDDEQNNIQIENITINDILEVFCENDKLYRNL
jgi:hypothetical protein